MSIITSLTNLQILTNLNNLNADWNDLEFVDLSNLPSLTTVDLSDQGATSSEFELKDLNLSGSTAIISLRLDDNDFSGGVPDFSGLVNLQVLDIDQCQISGSFDSTFSSEFTTIDVGGNTGLTNLVISSGQPIIDLVAASCALTQESVDNILVALSQNGVSSGYVDLQASAGTNAIPGATGLAAKSVLEGNGWTVYVTEPIP
jgi:hypothetical protein